MSPWIYIHISVICRFYPLYVTAVANEDDDDDGGRVHELAAMADEIPFT